jgi:biopolymer transport protein ExbB
VFGAIDRKTHWLATIASVAPMFGLAGTVEGMIFTFQTVSVHGNGDPRMMAAGIYVSLVTTLFGILLSIPCVALHRLFSAKLDQFHDETEKLVAIVSRQL